MILQNQSFRRYTQYSSRTGPDLVVHQKVQIVGKLASFPLTRSEKSPTRLSFLIEISQLLEFSVLSHSVTLQGYKDRVQLMTENVKLLAKENAWSGDSNEEFEDAKRIVRIMTQQCKVFRERLAV